MTQVAMATRTATWAGYSVEVDELMAGAVGIGFADFEPLAIVRSTDASLPIGDVRFAVRARDLEYARQPSPDASAAPNRRRRPL